jgi:hypothetical protein
MPMFDVLEYCRYLQGSPVHVHPQDGRDRSYVHPRERYSNLHTLQIQFDLFPDDEVDHVSSRVLSKSCFSSGKVMMTGPVGAYT